MKKEKKPKTKTVKQKKVKPQKIKQKKVKAPKYIPVKPVFGTAEDYYIYRLNPVETATGALLGGIVGFFFSMVFFRNVIFSLIVGLLLVVPGIRKYRDYLNSREEAFSRIIHWNSQREFLKTARIIIFLFYAGMTSGILHVQRNRPMRP